VPALPAHRRGDPPRRLKGLPARRPPTRDPPTPFFCSNRRNRPGCGGTFSLLWSDLIAGAGIAAAALLDLISGVADGRPLHRVWHDGAFPFSITTAYRWLRRWHRGQPHLRTRLARDHPPPRGEPLPPASRTLRHLHLAFPQASCPVAAFQHAHQVDFLP